MSDLETLDDGTYTAVVDSVEDGFATVFFERDGDEVGNAVVESSDLPESARHADAILSVDIEGGTVASYDYDPERTESRNEAAQNRFDQLSSRPPSAEDSGTNAGSGDEQS
ncbi:DUF3006 domain-containing protein [Halosimplex rubrum]|uniref:DUF3006 domain-containing protein n=1 Tax=Halosimplex rubrum TaxID=869889 RepID=A0A7D5P3G6_9EURY|nr:DUF3006 domain-containing protein [Halosimplex rubrum]QLH77244.1 DUF3006 domain-containing protein [Halosimplex rubrum]